MQERKESRRLAFQSQHHSKNSCGVAPSLSAKQPNRELLYNRNTLERSSVAIHQSKSFATAMYRMTRNIEAGRSRRRASSVILPLVVLLLPLFLCLFVEATYTITRTSAQHSRHRRGGWVDFTEELQQQEYSDSLTRDGATFDGARQLKSKSESYGHGASLGVSSTLNGKGKGKGGSSRSNTKDTKKSNKKSKGGGNIFSYSKSGREEGKGKGGDNYGPVMSPVASPIHEPSAQPTRDDRTPSAPNAPPQGFPFLPSTPTSPPVMSPESPVETPRITREPSTPPPSPTSLPSPTSTLPATRCSIGSDGVFGSQIGLREEQTFAYQAIVIPSVTAAELNLNILNKVETTMGERVLAGVFDQCGIDAISVQDSKQNRRWSRDYNNGRMLRQLQSGTLTGFSTRPRDTVAEGGTTSAHY
jgi:hypothetical protein